MFTLQFLKSLLTCSFNHSGQGKTQRNAGWDFSIGGSGSTGTVRSAVRPPQIRDRKTENQATQKRNMESGTRRLLEASRRDSRESDQDRKQDSYRGGDDDVVAMDGTGTVVVRSPRTQTSSLFSDQSTMVSIHDINRKKELFHLVFAVTFSRYMLGVCTVKQHIF